jgi:hypothetical protein
MQDICKNCNKLFSNKYNLKRHLDICLLKNNYKCEYCDDTFSRNYLLSQHLNICKCKKYKDKIDELEKINEELKMQINNHFNKNININDIKINNFSIFDILDYGKSIGLFICSNNFLLKKIELKNKKKKIIQYMLNDIIYVDNGFILIQYLLKLLKNKIIELINEKYSFIDENNILYNEHTKRILDIKNIELDEILVNNKTNKLYNEIIKIILDNII